MLWNDHDEKKMCNVRVLLFFIFLVCVGCDSKEIASGVDQEQASKIVSELYSSGVIAEAQKESGGKGRFSVTVPVDSYQKAMSIVSEKSLLRNPQDEFQKLIGGSSFFPASRSVEGYKLDTALGLKLETLLLGITGVKRVSVMVRQKSLDDATGSAASITLQARESIQKEQIADIVQKVIPGIDKEKIGIIISPIEESPQQMFEFVSVMGIKILKAEYVSFVVYSLIILALFGFGGAALGFFLSSGRESVKSDLPIVFRGERGAFTPQDFSKGDE